MIVMKFGGTSVRDAEAIDRACAIVQGRVDRAPLVVVSALSRVTSSLLEAARLAGSGSLDEALAIFESLRKLHLELLPTLEPDLAGLRKALEAVSQRGTLEPAMADRIAAHGELLSSHIFAARLSARVTATYVDSGQCIVTDENFTQAKPIFNETLRRSREVVAPLIKPGVAVVMGGYVASTLRGEISTLGRGGSDYSATLLAACLDADEVEIWTDVDGMMTADPRIVQGRLDD